MTEPRQVGATARRAAAGLEGVEVRIVADTLAETDPRCVERILTNLVTNALRHGAPSVTVDVDEDYEGAIVGGRDHGPGFPPDLLSVLTASGPQRFRTGCGSAGTGLGLTIASGQARLLGARLTFRNNPDGGAEATLRLTGAGARRQPGEAYFSMPRFNSPSSRASSATSRRSQWASWLT
ncbi:ATP-binding protein [Streptomyces sp. NPDC051172]|uniref:sensor histidine kinase n=1 Tax=Streptomyces sp. NPDC051172 TaxID=3155796 RepID=UPI00344838E4